MTNLLAPGTSVTVAPVSDVVLREVAPPVPSADEAHARDRIWDAAVQQNPALFDGPVSLVAAATLSDGVLNLDWTRGTYRNFALRKVLGATSWLGSLFVAVIQPTTDGRVVVGQMNSSTAAPGRWQLPGGTVDPPPVGQAQTVDGLRAHAALELSEELGIDVAPDTLEMVLVIRADGSNLGLAFISKASDPAKVVEMFEVCRAGEAQHGQECEFASIRMIGPDDLAGLVPQVEYLDAVLRYQEADVL